jgi:hypothetical protein
MKFKVTKSTQSTKGGFVNTIEGTSTKTVFGKTKTTKHLFLLKTDEALDIDSEDELNLSEYRQETYKWTDDEGNERTTTWLHLKAA